MDNFFQNEFLLTPPTTRAAYSDRTSWLMAEFSRLAYFKFEGETNYVSLAEKILETKNKEDIVRTLRTLVEEGHKTEEEASRQFHGILRQGKFKLVKIFNMKDTQAFIASSDKFGINVLAFRGTESIEDVKTDLKASTITIDNYKIHRGFHDAFQVVKGPIEESLHGLNNFPLYITGHSLGGALALIATKNLASNSLGACYTFGAPRVATSEFGDDIKTPIYRLVHAADIVPRVPPAFFVALIISIFELIKLPLLSDFMIKILQNMSGYRHHGDMRYLTACKGDYSDLRLISNPNVIDRFVRYVKRFITNYKSIATDHFMHNYCAKLEQFAMKRNPKK